MTEMVFDYDKEIASMKQKLAELEASKQNHEKKLEGIRKLDEAITSFARDYGVDEGELYLARSAQIVEWIKTLAKRADRPYIYDALKDYFINISRAESRKAAGKPKRAVKAVNEAVLSVGAYRNPYSGETVEKKKRNPKLLERWLEEYGLDAVREWKI